MPVLKVKNNGVWEEVIGGNLGDAETLGGKTADEFALASDVSSLQTLVGDESVSSQISAAISGLGDLSDGATVYSQADEPLDAQEGDLWCDTDDNDVVAPTPGENGATFTPHVDSDGNLSWSNDKDLENPATVNIKGPDGNVGATFTPSVDSDGNLSWSNDKELDNPSTVNIKGNTGSDGYTPVKGTDYWTDADKTEMVEDVINSITIPNITSGTTDLTAGSSALTTGSIYLVYE